MNGQPRCNDCYYKQVVQEPFVPPDEPESDDWQVYRQRGEFWEDYDDDKALANYTRAIELKPDEPELYMQRGTLAAQMEKSDLATADFNAALALEETAERHLELMELYRFSLRQPEVELYHLDQAIRLDPNCYKAYEAKYGHFLHHEKYPEALEITDLILQRFPDDPRSWLDRDLYHVKRQEHDQALAWLKKAKRLFPDHWGICSRYADSLRKLGRYTEALGYARELLEIKQDQCVYNLLRGIWQAIQEEQHFTAQQRRQYQEQEKLIQIGLYDFHDIRERILQHYSSQLESPGHPEAWLLFLLRGRLLETAGELENALNDYNLSIELYRQFPPAWYHRGLCLRKLGRCEESLQDLQRYVELEPYKKKSYFQRGQAHTLSAAPDFAQAQQDFRQALEIEPTFYPATYALILAYLLSRNPQALRVAQAHCEEMERMAQGWSCYELRLAAQEDLQQAQSLKALCLYTLGDREAGRALYAEVRQQGLDSFAWLTEQVDILPPDLIASLA